MRQNTRNAIALFMQGKSSPRSQQNTSIWTDGMAFYSYSTCLGVLIYQKSIASPMWIMNMAGYSNATSDKQRSLLAWMQGVARDAVHVGPLLSVIDTRVHGRGVRAEDLRARADAGTNLLELVTMPSILLRRMASCAAA
jgi:hypothetical protein